MTEPNDSPAQDQDTTGAKVVRRGRAKRRILPRDWPEIINMARNGVPVAKIAKTYKVQVSTIYRGLKERRVNIRAYSPSPADTKIAEEANELLRKVRETKERDYTYTDFLQREIMTVITAAKRDGVAVGARSDDIKTLKMALEAIRSGTANKWVILGLDKDNQDADKTLPELPVRELTEAEMIAIRDRQALEDLDDDQLAKLDAVQGDEEEDIVEEDEDEEGDEDA